MLVRSDLDRPFDESPGFVKISAVECGVGAEVKQIQHHETCLLAHLERPIGVRIAR